MTATAKRPIVEANPHPLDVLSDRQREIILRAMNGELYKEIALDLGISYNYVRRLMSEAYGRLGLTYHPRPLIELMARIHTWELAQTPK